MTTFQWYLPRTVVILLVLQTCCTVLSFTTSAYSRQYLLPNQSLKLVPKHRQSFSTPSSSLLLLGLASSSSSLPSSAQQHFDDIVESRYACTRFQRYDATTQSSTPSSPPSKKPTATKSNPQILKLAYEALELSRRAPSGFNTQPYRLVMVHSKSKKEDVAKYCLGRNADRVRDSDCTVIFLADKECLREYKRFATFLDESSSGISNSRKKKSLSKWAKRKMQVFILLFSSGWPLPRILSNPISFTIRLTLSTISAITRRKVLLPSLSSAETWSAKNTMLVAMTYMLACSSRNVATSPMEGFNVGGIRKVLNIPKRYAIPLIVSTGLPYQREVEEEGYDDVGMEHGPRTSPSRGSTLRYPKEEVIFDDEFGVGMLEEKIMI